MPYSSWRWNYFQHRPQLHIASACCDPPFRRSKTINLKHKITVSPSSLVHIRKIGRHNRLFDSPGQGLAIRRSGANLKPVAKLKLWISVNTGYRVRMKRSTSPTLLRKMKRSTLSGRSVLQPLTNFYVLHER